MILQKTLKHAMKWSLVLLTKYKKCSIVNAPNLNHGSCLVHLNIYLLMQSVKTWQGPLKRPITHFKARIRRGCKICTGFGSTNSVYKITSLRHIAPPPYDSS